MKEDELKYLIDIQLFVDELIEIVGSDKRFDNFNNNLRYRRAVER